MSKARAGVTLLEVLVAIFIMGAGMLALLVLFPLGALSMAQSLKDDRCAQCAISAAGLSQSFNLRNDSAVTGPLGATPPAPAAAPGGGALAAPNPNGPGYPVYADPFYATLPNQTVLAGTVGIQRVTPSYAAGKPARWFTLLDDITFDETGVPTGNTVQRQGWYTWAYLLKRGQTSNANTTDLKIVVYKGRSLQVPLGESLFSATANVGDEQITITYAGTAPAVRRGTWLLDVSYETSAVNGNTYGTIHGDFYRVTNTVDLSGTTVQVDVEPRIKRPVSQVVVMENVAEVFERGTQN